MARPTSRRARRRAEASARIAARVPANLAAEVATTGDGRDITRPWIGQLQQARDPRLMHSVDWGAYAQVLMDPEVFSTFQQRRGAVVSADWDVLPGDDQDPKSVEAADRMKENLEAIDLDRLTDKMLYATFHGYAVAELLWIYRDGLIQFDRIKVRHARRFRYGADGALRLLTRAHPQGEPLEDRKFWVVAAGASDDDEPYGRGLAEWLYWPTLFKRNGIRFWNIFLDKFGTPTVKGTYRPGTPKEEIEKLLQAIEAIATDSGFVIPEGMAVDLLGLATGTADFEKLVRYMDETIAKVILSQTMTTSDGASLSQAEVHAGVKKEVVTSDADLVCGSFNAGPARWWTDLNYGPAVASPVLVRLLDEEADLKAMADTDSTLDRLGWVRTEESHKDVYGDGYERKAAPAPDQPARTATPRADDRVPAPDNVVPLRAASFAELAAELRGRDAADDVDAGVAALLDDGWEPLTDILAPIAAAIAGAGDAADLDARLAASLAQSDVDRLTTALATAGFTIRTEAETGTPLVSDPGLQA